MIQCLARFQRTLSWARAVRIASPLTWRGVIPSAKATSAAKSSVHDSGQVHRGGRITKEGRSELRGALVEAAWVAIETHAHWKAQFARLSARIGPQKAIVAIARKLLVAIWHVLTAEVADINAEVQAVSRKLLQWVSRCGTTPGQRRSRLALLRQYLDQLGLEVDRVTYKGQAYRLPQPHVGPPPTP